jgi:hypothetical protein
MRHAHGINFCKNKNDENLPVIYICKDCGDEIEQATKYQIRQDRCYFCFKKLYKDKKFIKRCFMLEN